MSAKKSKSTQTTHETMTPTNPAWVEPQVQAVGNNVAGLSAMNPQSFFAGPDALQTSAAAGAGGLGAGTPGASAAFQGANGQAINMAQGVGSAAAPRASSYLNDYMNPYTNDVVNTSLADYDFGAGQTRAQNALSMANLDDTFGGSGRFIQTPMMEDALNRGRGTLSAGLRSQAFNTALGAAQGDAGLADSNLNRQLAAAGQMGTLAQQGLGGAISADTNQRANVGTQADLGAMLQQIAQARQQAPLTVASSLSGDLAQLPYGLFRGAETDGKGTATGTQFGGSVGWNSKTGFSIGG